MLLLRKACQPILNEVGLSELHVTAGTNGQRCLVLVGGCGKPLVYISGINFSKSVINVTEREYATELFAQFMKKHSKEIKAYVSSKKKHGKVEKPTLDKTIGTMNYNNAVNIRMPKGISGSVTVNINGQVSINYSGKSYENFLSIQEEILSRIKEASVVLKEMTKYVAQEKELQLELSKIGRCTI